MKSAVAHLNPGLQIGKAKKKSKYGNKKVEYDGHKFDSIKEKNRYANLQILLKAGLIKDLQLQVPFELNEGGTHSLKYVADFSYQDTTTGQIITEDTKGMQTTVYKKKKKLMQKIYGITIKET